MSGKRDPVRDGCDRSAARDLLRAFPGDARGNLAIMGALLMVPLSVLAGGATDFARAHQIRSELQEAVDAAALAGKLGGATQARAVYDGQKPSGVTVDAPVFSTDAAGTFSAEGSATSKNAFLSMVGLPSFRVGARASANARRAQSDVCVTTLETAFTGLAHSGMTISAPTCRFDIRSKAPVSASFFGGGGVSTTQLCVAGSTVNLFGVIPTNLQKSCTLAKPFTGQPAAPTISACDFTNQIFSSSTPYTLTPGTYCGSTMIAGAGAATFRPGLYIFKGATSGVPGAVTIMSSGSTTGDGVSFHFADSTGFTVMTSGAIDLRAPTSGARQGVLFNEAPGLPKTSITIMRSSPVFLKGLVYLPSRNLTLSGGSTTTADEVSLVVNTLTLSGAGTWTFKPAPVSAADAAGAPYLTS